MAGPLIVYGGSFDPPHRAHVELPRLVRQKLDADAVIYIPVGAPPHKTHELAPAEHRLAMLALALAGERGVVIDPIEVERAASGAGPTYTVDTLEALHKQYAGARLRLLIGGDQMRDFHRWKDPGRIIELAEPVVMVRGNAPLSDSSWAGRIIDTPTVDVTATEVRRRVRDGEPIAGLVHPGVERYIARHGLYRAR